MLNTFTLEARVGPQNRHLCCLQNTRVKDAEVRMPYTDRGGNDLTNDVNIKR
eukprot:gene11772-3485_t